MPIRFLSILYFLFAFLYAESLLARSEFSVELIDEQTAPQLRFEIAPAHYLYKEKLKISANGAHINIPDLPTGDAIIDDPLLGLTEVYTQKLSIPLSIESYTQGAKLHVSYQGCTEKLCYPPEEVSFALPINTGTVSVDAYMQPDAQQTGISLWVLLAYLGLGVGIAFTPCLYPMYPILLGSLARKEPRSASSFRYSFWYVQGLAFTYSLLGLLVASVGVQLQIYLQHPVLLTLLSVMFILMSASLLGNFTVQLPVSWTQRVTQVSQYFENKGSFGACAMGALAGLICSPCTTAPLSAALLYIAQTGDQLLGVLSLYFLSLGMGIPLLLMGLGYQKLPKSGAWLTVVPKCLGLALLVMPITLLSRFLPDRWIYILMLMFITFVFFYLWRHLAMRAQTLRVQATLGAVLTTVWLTLCMHQVVIPLQAAPKQDIFITLKTAQDLEGYLKQAEANKKNVVLDFTADWCSACQIMEKETFTHEGVRDYLQRTVAVRIDLSQSSKPVKAILKKYDIKGIPAILVFTPDEPQPKQRIIGQQSPETLLALLQNTGT